MLVGAARRLRQKIPQQGIRDAFTYRVPRETIERIDAFKPDVIYSMLASNPLLELCVELAERYQVPVVPHFMDDWPTTLYTRSLIAFRLRKTMQARLETLFHLAPIRLTISDAMADEYARRYGGRFQAFMNAVEPSCFETLPQPPAQRPFLSLVYAGGLHLGRWSPLADISSALEDLMREGIDARLVIHTGPGFAAEIGRLERLPQVEIGPTLAPDAIVGALAGADIVVHVESFEPRIRTYTKFSISTKIPECMASGRPILAYGPGEVASIQYVRESGAGLVVGQRNPGELAKTLGMLLVSSGLRTSLGLRGRAVAEEHHNAASVRASFRRALSEAAKLGVK